MKVKYSFEMMELDDGLVAIPVGAGADQFHGVLKINETGEAILKLLEQETTEEEIVENLLKEYSGDEKEIAGYVHEFLEKLISEGVIAQ